MTKTKPRTPEYFPKMKVRGARRKRLAPFQRMTGAFKRLSVSMGEAAESFKTLAEIVKWHDEECARLAANNNEKENN